MAETSDPGPPVQIIAETREEEKGIGTKGIGTVILLRKAAGEHYVLHETRNRLVIIRVRGNSLPSRYCGGSKVGARRSIVI